MDDFSSPIAWQKMLFVLQYMKREISDLRSRVVILEQENREQEVAARASSCDRGNYETCLVPNDDHTEEYIASECNFSSPRRCRKFQKQISMIPSIISLLITNNFIGAKEMGTLSCVSSMLHRLICKGDSDDEIWSYLLRSRWPSTTLIPSNILSGLSHRAWFKIIVSSKLPGNVNVEKKAELFMEILRKRKELRDQLNEGVFHPLPDPSLGCNDVIMLVDVFQDNKPFLSAAEQIDADKESFIEFNGLCIQQVTTFDPTELELTHDGRFGLAKKSFMSGRIHLVRLTDYKIICVSEFSSATFDLCDFYDESLDRDDLSKADIKPRGHFSFDQTNPVGNIPTHFNARLGDDGDIWFQGFYFELSFVKMVTPRSPYHYGYEYTVARYHDFLRNSANERLHFNAYRDRIWAHAATKPELVRFFDEAREKESKDGKYYGNFRAKQKWPCRVFVRMAFNSSERECFAFSDLCADHDDALLNLLEDLFDPSTDKNDSSLFANTNN